MFVTVHCTVTGSASGNCTELGLTESVAVIAIDERRAGDIDDDACARVVRKAV